MAVAFQCMAVYGLRPEDLRHLHTRNGGQEMWSNYEKSKGGKKGNKTEPRRLYPLLVHDIDGPISWHLKEQRLEEVVSVSLWFRYCWTNTKNYLYKYNQTLIPFPKWLDSQPF